MSDLKGKQTVGFECIVGLRNEATIDVEAGFPGEERCGGLMVADLGVEGETVGLRNIGRVADDGVETRLVRADRAEKVGLKEVDSIGYFVFASVPCGDGECIGGDVESGDVGVRKVDRECDRDGP